jgi:hypothetical protein
VPEGHLVRAGGEAPGPKQETGGLQQQRIISEGGDKHIIYGVHGDDNQQAQENDIDYVKNAVAFR